MAVALGSTVYFLAPEAVLVRHGMGLFREFVLYLRMRKIWWIAPIFFVMFILSGFIVWADASVILPFIYALF